MGFRETDHAFELAGGGGDALFGGADILAEVAHLNVGFNELAAGVGADGGVDVGAGVGNVRGEELNGLWGVSLVQGGTWDR